MTTHNALAVAALALLCVCWICLPVWTIAALARNLSPYTIAVTWSTYQQELYFDALPAPRTIVLTSKTKDAYALGKVKMWKAANPGYQVLLYDNEECSTFLQLECGSMVHLAFHRIPHGPIKADVFRAFYLYKRGGIYVDIDTAPLTSMEQAMPELNGPGHHLITAADYKQRWLNPCVIAATSYHPTLGAAVRMYTRMFELPFYTYWSWSIVHVLTSLHEAKAAIDVPFTEFCPDITNKDTCVLLRDGVAQFSVRDSGYDRILHAPRGTN